DHPRRRGPGAAPRSPRVGDFDEIAADHPTSRKRMDDFAQLGRADPARLRRAGPGRLAGIEDVDVDRDVERAIADLGQDPADGGERRPREAREEPWPAPPIFLARPRPE